ncbi:hypothetical protein FEM48_Zijuj10G0019800 [Ziziphus jujuba var. spinosa]|uniref:Uncharacterized protein n=1 Tax=Ziziphus jujuba var. spinosa TaxID=714518 RepID=A0A978UKM3_ZIZJJ|nr:hypothetical protein FEM48_Zijuj10G0019800 [Ziziphus jujuba var. spinosa]
MAFIYVKNVPSSLILNVLFLWSTEDEEYAKAPWDQKLLEEEDKEDMTLPNEKVSLQILEQLNEEIEKAIKVIQPLIIKKKGGQLTEEFQEFEERHAITKYMVRRLKLSVTGINFSRKIIQYHSF